MRGPLSINPLTKSIGAEIFGIDIRYIGPLEFEQISSAWLKNKVILIRDQQLSLEQLCSFSRKFGDLMRLPYITPVAEFPEVISVLKQADEINMGVFGGDWHSDFSFLDQPPKASILYAEEVPAVGGDTLWINMTHALENLPSTIRERLQGARAIHTGAPYGVKYAPDESIQFKGSIEISRNNEEADAEISHPAICRNPDTGEQTLFVNPTYTIGIEGLEKPEGEAMLSSLFGHCTRPEFSCRIRWRPGTVAIWDNRNTMHYAVNDYDGQRRQMFRTTIAGHRPLPVI